MRVRIPVAAYHEYNTAVYVKRAFNALGHEAEVITQAELYELTAPQVDLVFGVDSAGPLSFPDRLAQKTAMWFIDSRHNCNSARRNPPDDVVGFDLSESGGWVFQAQKRDWEAFVEKGILRCTWLPLAADPDVWWWPDVEDEEYLVGFYGNVWCEQRRAILEMIRARYGNKFLQVTGAPRDCARAMAACRVLFNVSGWFGTDIAYDVNMRVFESMSLGKPLVTNYLPELLELGFQPAFHYMAYSAPGHVLQMLDNTLEMSAELRHQIGNQARRSILEGHTYVHRVEHAIEILIEVGVLEEE